LLETSPLLKIITVICRPTWLPPVLRISEWGA